MRLFPTFGFSERMAGTHLPLGGHAAQPFHFELAVSFRDVSRPLDELIGEAEGRLTMAGVAEDVPAEGRMELCPFSRGLVRYALRFSSGDGRRLRFEGTKKISWLRPLSSWTTLDGHVYEEETGAPVGRVQARFDLLRQLAPFVFSFRSAEECAGLEPVETPKMEPAQLQAAVALARAILPATGRFRAGDERTVEQACELAAEFTRGAVRHLGIVASMLDRAAILRTGRRFSALDPEAAERLIRAWEHDPILRWPLGLLAFALKSAHFDDPEVYATLGGTYEKGGRPEPVRWVSQITSGAELRSEETVECDVVVVGTGAGGAVVGKELAQRGHAVVFVEEGEHYRRDAFIGRARGTHARFYRLEGSLAAGNAVVPVMMGRMIGGSTAVNTGTCFRTPKWVLDHWCEELGTDELSTEKMTPYFEQVERELEVGPSSPEALGGPARIVARGCDALGWRHFPVLRNAPGCDGQGVCDYGCPTDARKSMNLSYVPRALERGAVAYTGSKAERVLVEGKRAVGVEARTRGGGRLTVRARAVVLAGGAIPTPLLLLGQGLANSSDQVGRNLSLHPATAVSALFDERVAGFNSVPQGYCCDEFHREGILLLGASAPIDLGANMFRFSGRRLMELMESYDRVSTFGIMVEDDGRGRVRRRADGTARVTYFLSRGDVGRLHRGMGYMAQIYLAAGARRVFPLLERCPEIEGEEGLRRFRELSLRSWDLFSTSFHPLGTCRMGTDPRKSVIGLDHQTHDVERLFIVDGSALPGPTAVNPQMSIMGFAVRAAERIHERLA